MSRPVHQSFARVTCLGQYASPLPESHISTSPPVLCPSHVPWPVRQSFARVAYLGRYASPLLESHVSASPSVLCPSCISRLVHQSFARVIYLGQSTSPLFTNLGRSFARTVYLIHLSLPYGPEATRARGHPLDSRSASVRPLSSGGRLIGYPMGRSDSSKPTPDGRPRQHFRGSHVSPRDQVDGRSGVRGGGALTRHCLAHAH
ncbi:hypothetical protein B296_00008254 [Ensete ventricosum]|uniref:Uncharacterized protein n=1 Tax=Ensete ventricosum TaxID=4639 RepID=A0A426XYN9_ENSVE|nr:hypothetical protein B296_00008254 [Ensete ventricosum]